MPNQGGSHEQHVKAGQQSHKNADNKNRQQQQASGGQWQQGDGSGMRGGTHEQHVKAGEQSHKNR
ncbi:MAG: hypothetical protein EOS73_12080 [Mesorhizobium sp.]|uniref:hypothetical protein n=1 Tax=Mesorhizobium sp. M7A.F.Ca.ET.027.02.1.1 TaxID=2496655 RepID=UPI000FD2B634|nr:hypothetical protein [Mesorhizobium sp. M7A.F.Ca.ET.027.02.1.1]RVD12070.1 hypothetical protein EN749_29135 [Mesorhizobium sp. M7A.F.Ca.ET.027.02.1.1]RWD09145.1 MAG: hypothetical protein EOS73_12080 [Mesorhizobium sp.]